MKQQDKFDAELRKKINSIEEQNRVSDAEELEIWNRIQTKRSKPSRATSKHITIWVGAIAASLALLLLAYSFFYSGQNEEITFSKDNRVIAQLKTQESEDLAWAEEFIRAHCKTVTEICENPEFTKLQKELNLIDDEMNDLELMISQYGADEFLVQAKIKIENHKSEITFRLVQMLMS